jgi:hypothetical protein
MRNFPVKNRRTRYGRSLTATPSEPQRLDECTSGSAPLRVPEKHRKQSGDTQQQSVHGGHDEGAQAAGTTSGSRSRKRHTPSVTCPGSRATGAVSVECSLHWRRRLLVSQRAGRAAAARGRRLTRLREEASSWASAAAVIAAVAVSASLGGSSSRAVRADRPYANASVT